MQGRVRVSRAIITRCPSIIGVVLSRRARLASGRLRHVHVTADDGLRAVVGEVQGLVEARGALDTRVWCSCRAFHALTLVRPGQTRRRNAFREIRARGALRLPPCGIRVDGTRQFDVVTRTIEARRTGNTVEVDFEGTFRIPRSTQTIVDVYGSKLAMVAMGRAVFANKGVSIINCKVLPLSGFALHTGGGSGGGVVLTVGTGGADAGGGGTCGCRILAGLAIEAGAGVCQSLVFSGPTRGAYECVTTCIEGGRKSRGTYTVNFSSRSCDGFGVLLAGQTSSHTVLSI